MVHGDRAARAGELARAAVVFWSAGTKCLRLETPFAIRAHLTRPRAVGGKYPLTSCNPPPIMGVSGQSKGDSQMVKAQLFTLANIVEREAVAWGDPLRAIIKAKYVQVNNGYESGTPVYRL